MLFTDKERMNKDSLIEEFKQIAQCKKFEYDKTGMTWGISHVRFVLGKRSNFNSIEDFFKEIMLNEKTLKLAELNNVRWEKNIDFTEWIKGLELSSANFGILKSWIKGSLDDVEEYSNDWIDYLPFKINDFHLPINCKNVIQIKETIFPRFAINTYTGFICENEEFYFFFEDQIES